MNENPPAPSPSPPRTPLPNALVRKPPKGHWRDFFSGGAAATDEQITKETQRTRGYSAATAKPDSKEVKPKPKLRLVKGGKR